MNVYDFDGTIYNGDSSVDLIKMLIFKKPIKSIPYIFSSALAFIKYKRKKITKEQMKETCFGLFSMFDNRENVIKEFWDKHYHKIKDYYLKQKREDDVIISASPEFNISYVANKLGVKYIASKLNINTLKYEGLNCHGPEKINRFKEMFGTTDVIDKFYSDSHYDIPLAKCAKEAYLVKGNKINKWIL